MQLAVFHFVLQFWYYVLLVDVDVLIMSSCSVHTETAPTVALLLVQVWCAGAAPCHAGILFYAACVVTRYVCHCQLVAATVARIGSPQQTGGWRAFVFRASCALLSARLWLVWFALVWVACVGGLPPAALSLLRLRLDGPAEDEAAVGQHQADGRVGHVRRHLVVVHTELREGDTRRHVAKQREEGRGALPL